MSYTASSFISPSLRSIALRLIFIAPLLSTLIHPPSHSPPSIPPFPAHLSLSRSVSSPVTEQKIREAQANLKTAVEAVGYELMPGEPYALQWAPPLSRYLPRNNPLLRYWKHEVAFELAPPPIGEKEIRPIAKKQTGVSLGEN